MARRKKAQKIQVQIQPACPGCSKNDQPYHHELTEWYCRRCKRWFRDRYYEDGDRQLDFMEGYELKKNGPNNPAD